MKGIILDKGQKNFTYLKEIFEKLDDFQKEYNWFITNCECYPENEKYYEMLIKGSCWLTGEQLAELVTSEDPQWIWGVLSGFKKDVSEEEVMEHDEPQADGYEGFWKNPVSIQHSLADIELVSWDGSLFLMISKNDDLIQKFKDTFSLAKDLEEYNKE